ncbi:DUF3883 domain-containing protein [Deinococcus arenae]|uniref:DUF3883 domain-containing protein n=1 Tax=Deinococcus arenae TaxID=1452751 RepID=UPI0016673807|nr:DUF3883 domain-containing protein [Deinococcus arenae]
MTTPSAVEELDYGYSLLGSLRKDLRMLQGFSTVVQELIQNAEDAPGSDTFWMNFTPEALRVGNSGVFEDQHFNRIIEIASGGKRHDPDTIGSFGVGFVSVYQITDEPRIYSRNQARILRPLERKALKQTGVTHEWPSTFVLPWATQPSRLRQELEVEPVDLDQMDAFLAQAQDTFNRSAVFLRKVRALHLMSGGTPVNTLTLTRQANDLTITSLTGEVTYRLYDVPVSEEVKRDAERRRRRTTLQLALPLGEETTGLLYAFLPTRDETGLPLHINADFYPNTDRKGLLWDEEDKRKWNERLLNCVIDFVPHLLEDLADISPETLYTFADQVRLAAQRTRASQHPVARFVARLWTACQQAFKERSLFWSQTGDWVDHGVFLLVGHDVDVTLEDAILRDTHWHLPPPEHKKDFRTLFRVLGVQPLDATAFVDVLEQLFGQDATLEADTDHWPLLTAVFAYFGQLTEHEQGWESNPDLPGRLSLLHLALNAEGTLLPLPEVWTCPDDSLSVAQPWLGPELLIDPRWWDLAPPLLRDALSRYEPADLVEDLQDEDVAALIASGWPLGQAYRFLESDPRLGGERLRSLPIYRTTAGTYSTGRDLAIAADIHDPFHVRQLLDVNSMKGHETLLEWLNLPVLDAATYYGTLLPDYFRVNPERRRDVIELVAQEYGKPAFPIATWRALPSAELNSGAWVKPDQAYWPQDLLDSLFGATYPAFARQQYRGRTVRPFMEELGMRMTVADRDIIDVLQQREQDPVTDASVAQRRKVLHHALQTPTSTLSIHLSKLKWLPAKGAPGWYAPGDLLRADDEELVGAHLAGKQVSRLPLPERSQIKEENLRALGFARAEARQVVDHIRGLNSLNRGPNSRQLNWLNSRAASLPKPLRDDLRTLKIFPLGNGTFAPATHVFRQDPKLGRWRNQVGAADLDRLKALLDALSVAFTPQPVHHRDVLMEISSSTPPGEVPKKDDQEIAEQCFKALSDAYAAGHTSMPDIIASLQGKRVIPVFWKERTRGSLVKAQNALYLDKPVSELTKFGLPERFDARTRDVGTAGFFEALGVKTVSSVWKLTYQIPPSAQQAMPEQTRKMHTMTPVLLRLALKVHRRSSVNELRDRIYQFRFYRCKVIPTTVELQGFQLTGRSELSYAIDLPAGRLYIRDLNLPDTAKVLAEMLDMQDPSDRGILSAIWGKPLPEAQEFLSNAGFPELPEEYVPVELPSVSTAAVEETGEDFPEDASPPVAPTAPSGPASSSPRPATSAGPATGRPTGSGPKPGPVNHPTPKTTSSTDHTPAGPTHPPRPSPAAPPSSAAPSGPAAPTSPVGGPQGRPHRPTGTHPGTGQRSPHSPSRQQRFRNYTYVYQGPEENEEETHAREVDQRGMAYVMEHERRRGHIPEDVSMDYGAGYDICSVDQDGVIRYIELKTMSGPWQERGVALSANQFAMARQQTTQYWLYVIENLDGEPTLHEIQNPFERITSYTFDNTWKLEVTTEDEVTLG